MEDLPVEVIGDILSRLECARYVVIASAVCRKWREARKNYIHTLVFNIRDWNTSYWARINDSTLSIIVPQILVQTSRVDCLSIVLKGVHVSADSVISWVMHSRDTLRELHYDLETIPNINILQKCDLQKLEVLNIRCYSITWVEPIKIFPCLRSVSMTLDIISPLDLSFMLAAWPNIEFLTLIRVDTMTIYWGNVQFRSNSLKDIHLENISSSSEFILEANNIENLHFCSCSFISFRLVGKNTLKYLKIEDVRTWEDFDIGDGGVENLEVLHIDQCSFNWEKFHSTISRSSKLTSLLIWKVRFAYMDIKTICACFPLLTRLSLSYDWREAPLYEAVDNELLIPATTTTTTTHGQDGGGSLQLENVIMLELGWADIDDDLYLFSPWVPVFLERCPNLKELGIYGSVSRPQSDIGCPALTNFTSSIVRLMRKYLHVKVKFDY